MTTILQLSDLHIGPHNDEKDQKTYDLIHHMMTHYQPDITVLTG
ncbi:MAG: phosphohydrolase, partial [Staphylococcus sp.]|nr:phosphohydrolase [Staphylococcus sp.]